jgi:hypothetical protein
MPSEQPSTAVPLENMGVPIPVSYRVEQVLGQGPDGPTMYTKLYFAGPAGIFVCFLDGEAAEALGRDVTKAGKASKAGIWAAGGAGLVGEDTRPGRAGRRP